MDIIIEKPQSQHAEKVIFQVNEVTPSVQNAIEVLQNSNMLIVFLGNTSYKIAEEDICYVESIDLKTFVYTETDFYQIRKRLYEMEESLNGDFLKISKQMIVNLRKIKNISPAGGGRYQALLLNGEKVIISRQYVPDLKRRFGL